MIAHARESGTSTPAGRPRSQRGLHVFACVLVALTVGLIAAGAMVTSTGSGLSVPDWPTTYGENMFTFHPSKWVGGIFYEHGHRLFAASVGFLTIILAVMAQVSARTKTIRVLGWTALAAVIAQGVLGGMTVKFMLPTWISTFHACLAQTFLCILTTIAVLTHPRWESASSGPARPTPIAPLVLVIVIFCQLLAGALMRHTESGLAVPDFPLAYNQVLPSLTDEAVTSYNDIRAFDYMMSPVTKSQIIAHLAHRVGAVLVILAVIVSLISIRRNYRRDATANKAIAWIVLLVVIQATLGAYTIWTVKLALVATAHVAVGAATLGVAWRCFLLTKFANRRTSPETIDRTAPLDNALIQGAVA